MKSINKFIEALKNPKMIRAFVKNKRKVLGLSKQEDYNKFIVLGRSRTGSNLLLTYLNDHPNIIVHHEIFQRLGSKSYQKILKSVFKPYPESIHAVGFKIFYNHPLDAKKPEIWQMLKDMKNLYVIHLRRRNILRTLLSLKLALNTNRWVRYGPNRLQKQKCLVLESTWLEKGFKQTQNWESEAEAMFSDHPLITIYYEDLAKQPENTLNLITNFLGVKSCPTQTYLKRQNPEKTSKLIQNYDEIKAYFQETPWENFFVD